ncbi:DUF885 domain-containing protein [Saccharopolyspora sp. NPDC002376]
MTTVRELADEALELLTAADPLNELFVGLPGTGDRLNDLSEAAEQSIRDRAVRVLDAASRVEATGQDRITLGVLVEQTESLITRIDARLVEHTVHDGQTAPLGKLLELLASSRPIGAQQEQDFLTRLAAVPEFLAQGADRLRLGLSAGRLPIAGRVRAAVDYLDAHLAAPEADPLHLVPVSAAAERDELLAKAVRPAFAAYREVLRAEVQERGRPDERAGLCWLPDGEATYAALARMHTTTGHTPEDLHRTGIELLAELAEEYAEIGSRIFGPSTAAEVQQRMRTEPALRWSGGRELLDAARTAIERAERGAPEWFGRLPAQRCQVEPTPADRAPNASAAYYLPGPVDGSRPGTYYANTHLAEQRPRFLAEATAFHEAVPGHHFQITLAQELTGVPKIRQFAWVNSYMEGWGLYSERFADEAGWYTDDVARLGMLAMDSNRAARLVVDTGLHAFGWTRQRAVDYLRENTLMPEVEVQSETDRYLEMPGQALSYMVGRLEIERLRDRARAALGAAFDLRAFHDLVLGSGPLPMPVLDLVVADWTG